ncbi:MAG: hypothetical protein IPK99_09375 [Flavobacteriales bacterium]|nr:hypothetical protein [Flavobacteriales bacterium]
MTEWEGKQVDWVFRVNADGTPDTTFRSGVYVGGAYAFHGLADGRVYVGGSVVRAAAPNDTLNLVRFLMNGSLDPSFSIPTFSDGGLNGPFIGPSVSALYAWGADRFIAVGQFRFVNGEPRNGICMLDSTGQLLPAFNACGTGTFTFGSLTYASIDFLTVDTANNHIYVCGAYVGYDDGMVNDTQQRFVSRLYGDLTTTVAQPAWIAVPLIQVYPNPANSWVTINYALPASTANAELVVSHVSGRIMEQHMVEGDVGENRSYTLNVSGYAPGFYHLHLVVDGQWVSGCKMVVE